MAALAGCGSSPAAPSKEQVTDTLTGTLNATNTNVHTFTATGSGDIILTLDRLDPTPTITIGIGLGTVSNGSCSLQFANETFRVGTVWTNGVGSAGSYCVAVYDIGNLTQPVTYSITLVHP